MTNENKPRLWEIRKNREAAKYARQDEERDILLKDIPEGVALAGVEALAGGYIVRDQLHQLPTILNTKPLLELGVIVGSVVVFGLLSLAHAEIIGKLKSNTIGYRARRESYKQYSA